METAINALSINSVFATINPIFEGRLIDEMMSTLYTFIN
jgi:hypothetical protein